MFFLKFNHCGFRNGYQFANSLKARLLNLTDSQRLRVKYSYVIELRFSTDAILQLYNIKLIVTRCRKICIFNVLI